MAAADASLILVEAARAKLKLPPPCAARAGCLDITQLRRVEATPQPKRQQKQQRDTLAVTGRRHFESLNYLAAPFRLISAATRQIDDDIIAGALGPRSRHWTALLTSYEPGLLLLGADCAIARRALPAMMRARRASFLPSFHYFIARACHHHAIFRPPRSLICGH